MWRSDEGVAPYGCLCQPKHTAKPKFEKQKPMGAKPMGFLFLSVTSKSNDRAGRPYTRDTAPP